MTNIFSHAVDLIEEFVLNPDNNALIAGTGQYSVPFRGSLFGHHETEKVLDRLKSQKVKVLWLGSNPNCPQSLENISKPSANSDFESFLKQKQNKYFSEVLVNDQGSPVAWDPINTPDSKWRFYTEILDDLYGRHNVLMANYLPWGSKDYSTFLNAINSLDPYLFQRVIRFSNDLNLMLIKALQPELIVVSKSLLQTPVENFHLRPDEKTAQNFRFDGKVPLLFTIDHKNFGEFTSKLLISPHPSYTPRLGAEHRVKAQSFLKTHLV